jgi:hypothetical protein
LYQKFLALFLSVIYKEKERQKFGWRKFALLENINEQISGT